MKRISATLLAGLWGVACAAQQPLSAIDWLDEASTAAITTPRLAPQLEAPVTEGVETPRVAVTALDAPHADAVGLLPSRTTGLPKTLWQGSTTREILRLFDHLSPEPLPAIQALHYTLLLAEADAPGDTQADAQFLLARIKALRRAGAIEPALALIERAGPATKPLFDQWLDLALLTGQEDTPCTDLSRQPRLSTELEARIFCTARSGDWQTAALIFDSADTLGALSDTNSTLLALFLDPELIDDTAPPPVPKSLTPLQFRLFEAIGTPLPTHNLARAFAMADLRGTSGWKAEVEAAERLARTGALPAARLLGLYTDRKPAASGGVWDRIKAIQTLDKALNRADPDAVARALPGAWSAAQSQRLEVAFAELFADRLAAVTLPDDITSLAFDIALLSESYESAAQAFAPKTGRQRFLTGLATGAPAMQDASTTLEQAIATGFAQSQAAPAYRSLLDRGQLGEAILMATTRLDRASASGRDGVGDAIATLRAVGLEDTARRAALQMLLLSAQR
ncbi:hypothetical protein ROG8370_00041 [Roseovarius gaetbuli]|uniref:Uncharacterized protein n=1 Tax=Roseovarius gaetbuli TaxID=1356575 RepID=A0A1X6Y3Z6_9RHOB|nr:hypothetical protein [Roseovarius gaetbuli]SLN09623.1 hypothetical protein ROG8370_00041 [Roseovarius gaetbuli]